MTVGNFLYLIIKNLFYYFLYILLKVLSLFIKIRFQELETKNIGHYSKSIEVYLCENELNNTKKNIFDFWIKDKKVANQFLLKKWKKNLNILPSFFFGFLLFLKKKKFPIIPYKHPDQYINKDWDSASNHEFESLDMWHFYDINKVLRITKPRIIFSKKESFQFNSLLKKYLKERYSEKIILFYARDFLYKKYQHRGASDKSAWRNTNINTYLRAMNLMTKYSYLTIRVGQFMENKIMNNNNNKIFDYSFSEISSDEMDIYLCSIAKFGVFDSGGLNSVPCLFRTPIALVNITHLREIKNRNDGTSPLIIFKKIFSNKMKRNLTFSEYEKFKVYKNQSVQDFLDNDLVVIDNTEEEIADLTVEAENLFCNNNYNFDEKTILLQKKAKLILKEFGYGQLDFINIGSKFLLNNQDLIR